MEEITPVPYSLQEEQPSLAPKHVLNNISSQSAKITGRHPEAGILDLAPTGPRVSSDKLHRLGWKRLTICLIVEAIALGSLSLPNLFARLGMILGIITSVSVGLMAIYTSYVVGQVKIRYPECRHYSDAIRLIWGRFGYELTSFMFCMVLTMLVGAHSLTGTVALINITQNYTTCAVAWSAISLVVLFFFAIPPSFAEFSWLGYIDFVSILLAIGTTIIATGLEVRKTGTASDWSLYPDPSATFHESFLSLLNLIFAYSFVMCQFSFMNEMHTPKDYVKAIWTLGLGEIFIYTFTGATIYVFVGTSVKNPALLSAGHTMSRIVFGIALPVIFISGSINTVVVGKFIMDRAFKDSLMRYVKTARAWAVWISLIASISVTGWLIAQAIPFFGTLLGLISCLFMSGFSFYFPALFWFQLLRKGNWYHGWQNILLSVLNSFIFIFGLVVLFVGTYASVKDIRAQYQSGRVRTPFTCDANAFA